MGRPIPKPGDMLVAKASMSLWTKCDDKGYFEVRNFEIGDPALLVEIYGHWQHWLVYCDDRFSTYDTPHVWDDYWDLLV